MSEKKAKKARQQKIVAKFVITCLADGNVEIEGPLDNFAAFRDAMNRAERAVLDRMIQKIQGQSKIIIPEFKAGHGRLQ